MSRTKGRLLRSWLQRKQRSRYSKLIVPEQFLTAARVVYLNSGLEQVLSVLELRRNPSLLSVLLRNDENAPVSIN